MLVFGNGGRSRRGRILFRNRRRTGRRLRSDSQQDQDKRKKTETLLAIHFNILAHDLGAIRESASLVIRQVLTWSSQRPHLL